MNLHKEGFKTILGFMIGIFTLLLVIYFFINIVLWTVLAILLVIFFIFILSFFRNPDRKITPDNANILCPADGKIVVVEKTKETEYLQDERIQVSIFMSPLNVHVNRNPVSGMVKYFKHHSGKFYKAWEPKASTDNERTTIVYEHENGLILMRQIAGALAKRIVTYIDTGDQVVQGEDMGFIKFGSRVDIFLPLDSNILVSPGQVVKGNIDVIATW